MALGGRSKNAKRSILRAEEMAKALELKKAGLSFRQIAAALKCSLDKAFQLVDQGRKEIPKEAREAYIAEIHERELAIVAAHWTKRHIPEHAKVIQASDQFLARLLGLEAPKTQLIDLAPTLEGATPMQVANRVQELFTDRAAPRVNDDAADSANTTNAREVRDGPSSE